MKVPKCATHLPNWKPTMQITRISVNSTMLKTLITRVLSAIHPKRGPSE